MSFKKTSDSCRIPFRFSLLAATAANIFGVSLQPNNNLSPRLVAEADAWALYRVLDLKVRLHPRNAVTADQVVGVLGANQDTTPATFLQVTELLNAQVLSADSTVPADWVKPSRSELAGMLPWYKTVAGAADTNEEAPGAIFVASTAAADNFYLEIRGVYEFKTSLATANTPLLVQLRERVREDMKKQRAQKERDRLISVLGAGTVTSK